MGEGADALSFRSRATRGDAYRNPFTPYMLVTTTVFAFGGVFVLRVFFCDLSRMGQFVFSWQMAVLVLGLVVGDGLPSFMADATPSYWIGRALFPVAVWAALACVAQPSWMLLAPAPHLRALADALANNYAAWLLADMRSDLEFRDGAAGPLEGPVRAGELALAPSSALRGGGSARGSSTATRPGSCSSPWRSGGALGRVPPARPHGGPHRLPAPPAWLVVQGLSCTGGWASAGLAPAPPGGDRPGV